MAIHTGYRGCGAYGGNRELMSLFQIIAAKFTKVGSLAFHTGSDSTGYKNSLKIFDELMLQELSGPSQYTTNRLTLLPLDFNVALAMEPGSFQASTHFFDHRLLNVYPVCTQEIFKNIKKPYISVRPY